MTTRSHVAEVLFFSSPHCKQCAAVRPTAVDVASSFDGEVDFREIDATANGQAAKMYNIRGVPTLIALRDDEELGRFVGARSHDEIAGMFSSVSVGERTRQTNFPTRSNAQARSSHSVRCCSGDSQCSHTLGVRCCRCRIRSLGPDPTVTVMSTSAGETLRPLNPPTVRHSPRPNSTAPRTALLFHDMTVTVEPLSCAQHQ